MRMVVTLGLIVATVAAVAPAGANATLSLEECVREALAANPDLGAATARADAADAAAAAVAAGRRPRLDLAAGYLYSERAQRLAQPSFPGELLRYDNDIAEAALELRAPLYAGGSLLAGVRAADLAAAASRMARASTL
jgi:outer membrane protein TolC